jgi:hypothetical protein
MATATIDTSLWAALELYSLPCLDDKQVGALRHIGNFTHQPEKNDWSHGDDCSPTLRILLVSHRSTLSQKLNDWIVERAISKPFTNIERYLPAGRIDRMFKIVVTPAL